MTNKGMLVEPASTTNISEARRQLWFGAATSGFVTTSFANRRYYTLILEALWPMLYGIPGPILHEDDIRTVIESYRIVNNEGPYRDVFRRMRELQGDEGFTSIIKEGRKYQLVSLDIGPKRAPRSKPNNEKWLAIKKAYNFRCAQCGKQEPDVKLSPDHRQPRARGGTNDDENLQPLCEQCNIIKSSTCQGCHRNCFTCPWAFPETYKTIEISDENKEQIKRAAENNGKSQTDLVNEFLRNHFNYR